MNGQGSSYVAVLRQLVEEDIAKQMGKPIHNRYHNVQVLPFSDLLTAQVLVDLPCVGLPLGANCHWTVHSGHLARGLGAL